MLKQFSSAWEKARKSIFRLELLPLYNVPGDWECYQKFLTGENYIAELKGWFNKLKITIEKDVKTERVRVFDPPVNDYIKYEIDAWRFSDKAGDKIFFLDLKSYKSIIKNLQIEPEDFWLFDDSTLIIFHYDATGAFIGEENIGDKELIKNYAELKYNLLNNAVPYKEFIKSV